MFRSAWREKCADQDIVDYEDEERFQLTEALEMHFMVAKATGMTEDEVKVLKD